jgi:hypothetical protein
MNKTERLKQLAAELNEKFPVGSIEYIHKNDGMFWKKYLNDVIRYF